MGAGESSSSSDYSNTTGPVPIRVQEANPLLYTLRQENMNVQPYWIMILQIIARDIIFQRLWNYCRYQTWATTQEIAIGRWVLDAQTKKFKEAHSLFEKLKVVMEERHAQKVRLARATSSITASAPTHRSFSTTQIAPVSNTSTRALWALLHQANQILPEEIDNSNKKIEDLYRKLKFDMFDFFIHALPVLVHTVWYFYIQSSCMEAAEATVWNCYNAFGYRLYNYIFVSYCAMLWLFIVKFLVYLPVRKEKKIERSGSFWKQLEYHVGFWSSIITIVVVGVPIFPYIFTHVIPMACIYLFMLVIYALFWMTALFFTVIVSYIPGVNRILLGIFKSLIGVWRGVMAIYLMFPFTLLTLPILMSVFYNYSQYFYYGDDFYGTMRDEFDSRDTVTYLKILRASLSEQWHTGFNFI